MPRLPIPLSGPALLVLAALVGGPAHAACDALVAKAGTVEGEAAAKAWGELLACDRKVASTHFDEFMRSAKDVDSLVALTIEAIGGGVYKPLWTMLDKISDYGARDNVARRVGESCADQPKIVDFLQITHRDKNDREFAPWRSAILACDSDVMTDWLRIVVAKPPARSYDDKYSALSEALVKRSKVNALTTLEPAAIAAGKSGGPFTTLMDRMQAAIQPEGIGQPPAAADLKALEQALVRVAQAVPPEQAAITADRLYQTGSEEAAATLLPSIYPDRVQGDGSLLYGVAGVESCDGEAVVHYAAVNEPVKRWSINDAVASQARSFKARLKCAPDGDWPVFTTPEPVNTVADVESWANTVVEQWAGKGLDARVREEKPFRLN